MAKTVDVSIVENKSGVLAVLRNASDLITQQVAEEFLADANEYVRMRTGSLKQSSINNSRLKDGVAVWQTPYAARVYFTGKPDKTFNPNASLMWAEKAYQEHKKEYEKMAQTLLDRSIP